MDYTIGNDDYPFTRGDDYELAVRWTDSEGEPVLIDSCRLQVRFRPSSETTILSFTDSDPELSIDENEITVSFSDTDDFPTNRPVYDLEATSVSGQVKTLIEGRFVVREDVSR